MISFKENVGLVHRQAKFGLAWASQAGVSMNYDDMFQEASVAFVLATNGYDPTLDLKFSTYYTKVAFSQIRRTLAVMSGVKNLNPTQRKEIADRKEENKILASKGLPELPAFKYGINPIMFSSMDGDTEDGEGSTFEQSIASDSMTPEEILEHKQSVNDGIDNLSPLARLMLDWLTDPPQEMLDELNKREAYENRCVEIGEKAHANVPDGITFSAVSNFISLVSNTSRKKILSARTELLAMSESL
jgi:DNA-directed RNA polymerase sigma subunit (sigma70/sigma32)